MGLIRKNNGDILYAENLNDNAAFFLDKTAITLINSGDSTYADPDIYLNADILGGTLGDVDSSNSTMIFENGFPWAFTGEIYDTPDSSIDATKWTFSGTTSTTETASNVGTDNFEDGYVEARINLVTGTQTLSINTSTGLDMKNGTSVSECALGIELTKIATGGTGGNYLTFFITDGSVTVNLHAAISQPTASETRNYRYYLRFDGSAEEVYYERYYLNSLNASGTVDLSSLTGGKYYMKWTQLGNVSENYGMRIKGLYYAKNNSIASAILQTTAQTLSESKASGWGGFYEVDGITSPVYGISADGSNFTTFLNKQIANITNAGSSGVLRLTTGAESNATLLPKIKRIVGMW